MDHALAQSAWLCKAPPWEGQPATGAESHSKKRKVDKTITEAESTLVGKLASRFARRLRKIGWRRLVSEVRGASNITEGVAQIPHPTARLLHHLRERGASVPLSMAPWSREHCDQAMERDPHQSLHGEREFVAQELLDFCEQGYWIVVLPYRVAVDLLPGLRVSPLGVVPQRERRPRLIVDYTFSGINAETLPWAPREAMQFGRASLQRVFTTLVHAHPKYGPVHLAKIDVADGFYRVWLQMADIPKLGVALPTAPNADPLVALPLVLPMGWVESPHTLQH